MVEIKFSGRQMVRIADILYSHYSFEMNSYGKIWIDPLPKFVETVFGEQRLTYYPMYPDKKIRDFIRSLSAKEILLLLNYISENDDKAEEITNNLNEVLEEVGIILSNGKIIHKAEGALELTDDEITFLTKLDSLGYSSIKNRYDEGIKSLRQNDLVKACSLCCLAFDGLLKNAIISKQGNIGRSSLGSLVNEGVRIGLIEQEVEQALQGFISLRNKAPQHASSTGSVQLLSNDTTMLLAHLSRVFGAYLLNRI